MDQFERDDEKDGDAEEEVVDDFGPPGSDSSEDGVDSDAESKENDDGLTASVLTRDECTQNDMLKVLSQSLIRFNKVSRPFVSTK